MATPQSIDQNLKVLIGQIVSSLKKRPEHVPRCVSFTLSQTTLVPLGTFYKRGSPNMSF